MKFTIALLIVFGSPMTFAKDAAAIQPQVIDLQVTEKGFEPTTIDVRPGTSVVLKGTRKTDSTCATEIQVPSKKIKKSLPLNQTVSIDLGKLEKGEVRFACGMNMVSGQIVVR